MKAVKSSDPRKREFMDWLKQVSGGTKVTRVQENDEFAYGDCLALSHTPNGNRCYKRLGIFKVPKDGKELDGFRQAVVI